MWVAAGSDRAYVDAQLTGDLADDVGDPFDQPEADRARRYRDVDRSGRGGPIHHASGSVPAAVSQTPGA